MCPSPFPTLYSPDSCQELLHWGGETRVLSSDWSSPLLPGRLPRKERAQDGLPSTSQEWEVGVGRIRDRRPRGFTCLSCFRLTPPMVLHKEDERNKYFYEIPSTPLTFIDEDGFSVCSCSETVVISSPYPGLFSPSPSGANSFVHLFSWTLTVFYWCQQKSTCKPEGM